MPNASATPRRMRADVRREQVVDALIEVFLAEGFTELSIADLAGRLRCSKSTVYYVADSKEQIIVAVVRAYFRRATERIEQRLEMADDPVERIRSYLTGIAEELAPASAEFFADLDAFAPAREIYRDNTRIAARRVQGLVDESLQGSGTVDAAFVGVVAGLVMEAIHRGELARQAQLSDAQAFRALADLITAGVG